MGRNKSNLKSLSLILVIAFLATTLFGITVSAAGTSPMGISYRDDTVFKADKGEKVSINVDDADIRDILSLFATKLGVNIVYLSNSYITSFNIDGVDATTAFEIFMKSTEADGAGLSYVRDEDLMLVGSANDLRESFNDMMVITTFSLKYMSASDLAGYLSSLGIYVNTFMLDPASDTVFVQGFPYEVSKVNEIVNMLDKEEYFSVTETTSPGDFTLTKYNLNYISATSLEGIMKEVGAGAKTIIMNASPYTLWASGDSEQLAIISQLISKLDTSENVSDNEFGVYRLKYINIELVNNAMEELGLWADEEAGSASYRMIPNTVVSEEPYTILVNFKYLDQEMVDFLIAELDTPSNLPEDPAVFIYDFSNISTKIAMERIDAFSSKKIFKASEVDFKEFSFAGLGSQLMVLCTKSEEAEVREFLADIDEPGQVIKVVVDGAGGSVIARVKLENRIPIISFLSGVPESSMHVSGDVSKDDSPTYVMWIEDTVGNINKVIETIANIDGGSGE